MHILQNTTFIRKWQVISGVGGGGVHSLHPPPRSNSVYSHKPRNFLNKLLKRECVEISLEYVYVQYVVIGS